MAKKILEAVLAGRMILTSLRAVTSKYVKEERAAFERAQDALEGADARARTVDKEVKEAVDRSRLADQAQDDATHALAARLAGDDFDRRNPFKVLGVVSPSVLVTKAPVVQAQTLLRMAQELEADPSAKAESQKAALTAAAAANAVLEANKQKAQANLTRSKRRIEDQHLTVEWQQALTNLREALRYADNREGTDVYDFVFAQLNEAKAQAKRRVAVSEPVAPVI